MGQESLLKLEKNMALQIWIIDFSPCVVVLRSICIFFFFFFMSAACICRISVRLLLGNVLKTKIFNLSTCELIIFRLTDQFKKVSPEMFSSRFMWRHQLQM